MRRKIIAGNWKMNGDQAFIRDYAVRFKAVIAELPESAEVILAPPSIYLESLGLELGSTRVKIAAQNVCAYEAGAYTGEVSAQMLKDMSVTYSLVGHSERRALFGDTDEVVVAKLRRLLEQGVAPIYCVGETLEQRDAGQAEQVVRAQMAVVLDSLSAQELNSMIVAYEPVWAIGTGKTATPEIAQQMHACIRAELASRSVELSERCPILYGGSVNAGNAGALFEQQDIDGGLVGGASLKVDEFKQICMSMG